jgi:hypothetical protein
MILTPGMIVEVSHISKKSFWLARMYQERGMRVGCVCRWKRGTLGVVDSVYSDGTVIVTKRGDPTIVAVGYSGDLEPYYEETSFIEETQ